MSSLLLVHHELLLVLLLRFPLQLRVDLSSERVCSQGSSEEKYVWLGSTRCEEQSLAVAARTCGQRSAPSLGSAAHRCLSTLPRQELDSLGVLLKLEKEGQSSLRTFRQFFGKNYMAVFEIPVLIFLGVLNLEVMREDMEEKSVGILWTWQRSGGDLNELTRRDLTVAAVAEAIRQSSTPTLSQ